MKVYDIVVYKHVNGKWIQKTTVTQLDLEEMEESDFVEFVFTFTFDEWAELQHKALDQNRKVSQLLDELRAKATCQTWHSPTRKI